MKTWQSGRQKEKEDNVQNKDGKSALVMAGTMSSLKHMQKSNNGSHGGTFEYMC